MNDVEAVEEITDFIMRQSEPEEVRETLRKIVEKRATRDDVDGLLSHYARNFVQIFWIEKKFLRRG